MTKNLGNFSFESFLLSLVFYEKREGISSNVDVFLMVIDLKMVSEQFLSLSDMSGAQTFCISKSTEVFVIC